MLCTSIFPDCEVKKGFRLVHSSTRGESIKNCVRLKILLKKLTNNHVKKNPDVLTFEETNESLTYHFDDNDHKDLHHQIGAEYISHKNYCDADLSLILFVQKVLVYCILTHCTKLNLLWQYRMYIYN